MDEQKRRDDELFAALNRSKKQKRRKRLLTALAITAVIVVILLIVFANLRRRVKANIASDAEEVLRYEVTYGSVSTTVSGSGTIADVDAEEITVPEGVEIEDVLAEVGDRLHTGDVIATVDVASVLSTMADVQDAISELDTQIQEASNDAVSGYVTAGAAGRVKRIYAANNDDVASCMYDNGSLALLSLDGYMAVDFESDVLAAGDQVTVVRGDGSEIAGRVERVVSGKATVLVTDNGPELDEAVTVLGSEGETLGSGTLYIHSPLAVTGFAGTISRVAVKENQTVYAGSAVFNLTDTSYSARYDSLLKQRREKEDTLRQLMALRQSGALRASFDGTVLTIDYESDETEQAASSQSAQSSYGMGFYGFYGSMYGSSSGATTTAPASVKENDGVSVITMSHDERMSVTISVDESDILALQPGQEAEVTIDSVGGQTFAGTVTEVDKTASSNSGVTAYAAEITFDKAANMLSGMSADVVIRIQGTENVLVVPADAVHRTSAISFVYTEYDAESGVYGGMTPVVTGIANDDLVEVVSGLKPGQPVYYVSEDNDFFFGFYGSGNFPGPGGGSFNGGRGMRR
ncbi:MAG: HlyD family efflux transporter periplasmic adaptor subunit [Oscillospiraceae bacterium]|nr:HlyD family efflux transporter periplasmic adaptor subunit [Oscillospiraceae bacterium]